MKNFIKDNTESGKIYANLSTAGYVVNIVCVYFVGRIIDYVPSKIMIPIVFLLNAGVFFLITLIDDPSSILSYMVWCLLALSFLFESIAVENFFSRNVPGEIRGLTYGVFFFCGLFGRLVCYKSAALLFKYDHNAPFWMIGSCHAVYLVFVIIMIMCKKF